MDYKISIIMPALNEEKNIEKAIENVVQSFDALDIPGEIVVINDGSTDKTESVVKSLIEKYPFIRMICHPKPKGVGASYWEGLKESGGELVTWLPGDAENDAYEILRYLPLMKHVDILIPYVYNKDARSRRRRILSIFYKGIINLSFGMLLNYMNGTVVFRRCILKNAILKSSGFFFQTELLIKSIKEGYLYAEVPYALKQRTEGESKAVTLGSLLEVVFGYISAMLGVHILRQEEKSISPDSVTALRHRQLERSENLS